MSLLKGLLPSVPSSLGEDGLPQQKRTESRVWMSSRGLPLLMKGWDEAGVVALTGLRRRINISNT